MIARKNKKVKINLNNYHVVNRNTGELLKEANIMLTKTKIEDKMIVSSEKYVTLDTEAVLNIIKSHGDDLNKLKLDVGLLFLISPYISFFTNALVDKNDIPFTTKTLALELGFTQRTVKNSLNSLIAFGLVYQGSIKTSTYKNKKVYWVNPTLIRKGKDFLPELFIIFQDLTIFISNQDEKIDTLYNNRGN
jgi:predicted transcriptional regulator